MKKQIQINNFMKPNQSKINQESDIINKDIAANKHEIEMRKNQENQRKKKQSLKVVLSIMIDLEIVKRKMSKSLKDSNQEKYYILNYKWFLNYIKKNQLP